MGMLGSFLLLAVVALSNGEHCEKNIILGTVVGSEHSQFGGSSSKQHYTNENGVVVSYEGYTNYEQKPTGECVKKCVIVRNGVSEVTEIPIDCEEAKREIEKIAEETRHKINQKHKMMMKKHYEALDKIQNDIKEMQMNFKLF